MLWLLKNWKLVATGVTALALAVTIGVFKYQRDSARSDLKNANSVIAQQEASLVTLEFASNANLAYAEAQKKQGELNVAAVTTVLKAKEAELVESTKIIRKLRNVKPNPISPVVACYLEQLYATEAGDHLRPDEGAGEDGSPRGIDGLPASCASTP